MTYATGQHHVSLSREIRAWDGKSTDEVRAVYDWYCTMDAPVPTLVQRLLDPSHQKGASWLLKRHLDQGGTLAEGLGRQFYATISTLEHWESKLHVLQCLPEVPIPTVCKSGVEAFVRGCLLDDVKFVRAWAYYGFYELALQYQALQNEATQILELGLQDEPASVQARIRKALNAGF